MTDLVVMAIDLAKHRSGIAIGGPAWPRPFWFVHELSFDYDKKPGAALHAWRRCLTDTITKHLVTYVAVESFFIDMKKFDFNGTVPAAHMWGVLLELCAERGIKCGQAPIGAWRKRFLGSAVAPKNLVGRMKTEYWKERAVKACVDRNFYVTYHDEAEAIGILDFTLAALDRDYAHRTAPLSRRAESALDELRRAEA